MYWPFHHGRPKQVVWLERYGGGTKSLVAESLIIPTTII